MKFFDAEPPGSPDFCSAFAAGIPSVRAQTVVELRELSLEDLMDTQVISSTGEFVRLKKPPPRCTW